MGILCNYKPVSISFVTLVQLIPTSLKPPPLTTIPIIPLPHHHQIIPIEPSSLTCFNQQFQLYLSCSRHDFFGNLPRSCWLHGLAPGNRIATTAPGGECTVDKGTWVIRSHLTGWLIGILIYPYQGFKSLQ